MASYTLRKFLPDESYFDPSNDLVDHVFIRRYAPIIERLGSYFRPTYHGLDNVPKEGGALLVGNHGVIGFDGFFVLLAIYRATGRLPRGLGDYHLFMEPNARRFWTKAGAIPGTPELALRYLKAGNLVNVYPGGARDAMKGPDDLYRLHWQRSLGFVRLAIRAQVPIVLHMGIGTDETYHILSKSKWTAKLLGHAKYSLPLYMGWGLLPRPVKFDYYISERIDLDADPEAADDDVIVKQRHRMLWERGHDMLQSGLARRNSVWTG